VFGAAWVETHGIGVGQTPWVSTHGFGGRLNQCITRRILPNRTETGGFETIEPDKHGTSWLGSMVPWFYGSEPRNGLKPAGQTTLASPPLMKEIY
jgi:hypothetical protein